MEPDVLMEYATNYKLTSLSFGIYIAVVFSLEAIILWKVFPQIIDTIFISFKLEMKIG